MTNKNKKKRDTDQTAAVIYARVSSIKQTTRGDGLGSQETRCREFAKYRGYEIEAVFKDDSSGSLVSRPGMKAMLAHLRQRRGDPCVVIIDDISRLARGLDAHLQLRSAIAKAGGELVSPSIEFGEDSDSILVENLLASVSQHQRQKNGEQTLNRMKARGMNGYWPFHAPLGYRFERREGHGKVLVPDEPHASILREALEGYASRRFETQVEVKRFLERQTDFPKDLPGGQIRNQRVTDLLTRQLYAGVVEIPNWDISARPGKHEGLISFETFQTIQKRLKQGAKAPARADISADFPLRGFVLCDDCGKPLTANWSRSKTGAKHPYYICFSKDCPSSRKSIRRDDVEGEFESLLQHMQPSEKLLTGLKVMFREAWNIQLARTQRDAKALERDLKRNEREVDQLVSRVVETDSTAVIGAYEERIAKLERQKLLLQEKLQSAGKTRHTYEEMFELATKFLSSPWNLWTSGQLEVRKTVLRLAFADRIPYSRKHGLRTPKLSLPFKVLGEVHNGKCEMAHQHGLRC